MKDEIFLAGLIDQLILDHFEVISLRLTVLAYLKWYFVDLKKNNHHG